MRLWQQLVNWWRQKRLSALPPVVQEDPMLLSPDGYFDGTYTGGSTRMIWPGEAAAYVFDSDRENTSTVDESVSTTDTEGYDPGSDADCSDSTDISFDW